MLGFDSIAEKDRIIVALDCDRAEAMRLAHLLAGEVTWLKVGMTLYYEAGPAMIADLKDLGFNVFVDLKFFDIPHQVKGAAQAVAANGADMITMHGMGGIDMMEAAIAGISELQLDQDPITLAITVLTSMDQAMLNSIGVDRPIVEQVSALAQSAQKAGLSGVVASPQEAAMLRKLLGPEAAIVTPGVRPAGSDLNDQSRVATPRIAFDNGASHLVIGRPITQAADPLAAFQAIVKGL